MLPRAEKSHQAQRQGTSLMSKGTSMGLHSWENPRPTGRTPAKEIPCPSVQCSITTTALHTGTGCLRTPGQGPIPTFSEKPRGTSTLPA